MDPSAAPVVREHHVHQRHFDRLVMLSDGVFAIALTLSAVELRPEMKPGQTLLQAWGVPLLTYFASFFIVGGVWVRHRRMLAHLRRVDLPVTALTLLLLSLVSLTPVVIRTMLSEAERITSDGMLLYGLALMANYAALALGWGYAFFVGRLAPDVPRPRAWGWLLQDAFVAVLFGAVAVYSQHLNVVALLLTLGALGLRFGSDRLEKTAKSEGGVSPPAPDPRQ